ncbi:MAG TPA: C13 family peptidase [Caulobacteraceae bacterium]|nr:C13 family peptidase [Caulobacteraceae bacterium]
MRGLSALFILTALLVFADQPARAGTPFADWAVIIVAGDDHAHSGAHSEVFDNARRDLTTAFVKAGFSPANIGQFTVQTGKGRPDGVLASDPQTIADQLGRETAAAKTGCLFYFTSHGSPDGIVLGDGLFSPLAMASLIDDACGARPAVVVVAACFSGVFVPPLAGANRMVLTAARPDRASFGCGEEDRYTFFDTCMLEQLPRARNFAALGRAVQACVAKREADLGAAPPSEPQLWIGPQIAPDLPLLAFSASP